MICSGEVLSRKLQERVQERLGEVEVYNLYGPTEAAVDVTSLRSLRPSRSGCADTAYPRQQHCGGPAGGRGKFQHTRSIHESWRIRALPGKIRQKAQGRTALKCQGASSCI